MEGTHRSGATQRAGAKALALGLSAISGYVDTVGFLALAGLFAGHITGNFVLIGAALVHSGADLLAKLVAFPAFVGGVAMSRLAALALERWGYRTLAWLLLLELLLLAGFVAACGLARTAASPQALWTTVAGACVAGAMGLQNGLARLALPAGVPSTAMTGNVTQLVIDAVDLARGSGDSAARSRGRALVMSIACFALGCVVGAFAYVHTASFAMLLPICAVAFFAWRARGLTPTALNP